MRTALTAFLAAALHLLLGWQWVVLAAFTGGLLSPRRGWLTGGAGVLIAWTALIAYNLVVAGYETWRMLETFGGVLGGLPGIVILVITLVLAAFLGIMGGLAGSAVAGLLELHRVERT